MARTAVRAPARAAGFVGNVVGGLRDLVRQGPPPSGPFDVAIGPNRRFAMADAPVQRFKDIKNSAGGTVNDVVLAVVAGAMHLVLKARGEPTRGRTLRAMVPVSVRTDDERLALGNRVTLVFVDLPVGHMDPAGRLSRISEATRGLKDEAWCPA